MSPRVTRGSAGAERPVDTQNLMTEVEQRAKKKEERGKRVMRRRKKRRRRCWWWCLRRRRGRRRKSKPERRRSSKPRMLRRSSRNKHSANSAEWNQLGGSGGDPICCCHRGVARRCRALSPTCEDETIHQSPIAPLPFRLPPLHFVVACLLSRDERRRAERQRIHGDGRLGGEAVGLLPVVRGLAVAVRNPCSLLQFPHIRVTTLSPQLPHSLP